MMAKKQSIPWEPTSDDSRQIFMEQNPWHESGQVPNLLAKPIERPLGQKLWTRLLNDQPRRFQFVLGPRRVGKTTCLYQTVRHLIEEGQIDPQRIWWLRMDHPLLMRIRLDQLVKYILHINRQTSQELPIYLFIDELTYASDWDLWLKTFYDDQWPIRLAGSSSSTAIIKGRRSESGVGRWDERYLTPYLFGEFLHLQKEDVSIPTESTLFQTLQSCVKKNTQKDHFDIWRKIFLLTGGFPELLIAFVKDRPDEQTLLLSSQRTLRSDAVERAIYKDIPQAFGVDNPLMLERMLYVLAGQVTGILSPTDLCMSLDRLSHPTFDRYLNYLTQAFLIFTLPNYSGNEATKQRRGRKLYFVDSAVRNAALQRGLAPLKDPTEMGLLTENMVAAHLHALGQLSQVRLYHWRDQQHEIDLIFDHPDQPIAFEIAPSLRHKRSGLKRLMEKFPRFHGRCFLVVPNAPVVLPQEGSNGIGTFPLDWLLLAISAQAHRELKLGLGCVDERPMI